MCRKLFDKMWSCSCEVFRSCEVVCREMMWVQKVRTARFSKSKILLLFNYKVQKHRGKNRRERIFLWRSWLLWATRIEIKIKFRPILLFYSFLFAWYTTSYPLFSMYLLLSISKRFKFQTLYDFQFWRYTTCHHVCPIL